MPIVPSTQVYSDLATLQAATAERIATFLAERAAHRPKLFVVISGGSAPPGVFAHLIASPLRERMPWAKLSLIWADERLVPFDHPESNYRQARISLLDHVPIPSDQVYPVATYYEPDQAATVYQQQVAALLAAHDDQIDLALLGMGPDGHTASLFPGFPQLNAPPEALVLPVRNAPKPPPTRITLTAHTLNRAAQVYLLVAGADKAPAVQAALSGSHDPQAHPTLLIAPRTGQVTWLLDAAAAAQLP
ncbi:MAG: 6-phosphogluconolactonase [Oscillochloridaceae bacterium umkhey_bin13]